MNDIIVKAITAVKHAGEFFHTTNLEKESIIKKGFGNYVTQVDYQVQKYLVNELSIIIPGSNIITEESNENKFDLNSPTWILDPVDGTTNFMHQYQQSAISLGLFVEQKPVAGIVYNPVADEMFVGESGKGAFLNGERIEVSSNNKLEDCLIGFGTNPYDRSKASLTFQIVERIFMKCQDVRRSGSAALDLANVACGRMDGFFELTLQPWDSAAGKIILEAAGGKLTNWDGENPVATVPSAVLATNSHIHQIMLNFLY